MIGRMMTVIVGLLCAASPMMVFAQDQGETSYTPSEPAQKAIWTVTKFCPDILERKDISEDFAAEFVKFGYVEAIETDFARSWLGKSDTSKTVVIYSEVYRFCTVRLAADDKLQFGEALFQIAVQQGFIRLPEEGNNQPPKTRLGGSINGRKYTIEFMMLGSDEPMIVTVNKTEN